MHAPRHRGQHGDRDLGLCVEPLLERPALDAQQPRLLDHLGVGRKLVAHEYRRLGEALATGEQAHDRLIAVRRQPEDLHPAAEHHIEAVGGIVLLKQQLPLGMVPDRDVAQQRSQLRLGEAGEQRDAPRFYLGLILLAVGALIGAFVFFGTLVVARDERTLEGSIPLVTFGALTAAIINLMSELATRWVQTDSTHHITSHFQIECWGVQIIIPARCCPN